MSNLNINFRNSQEKNLICFDALYQSIKFIYNFGLILFFIMYKYTILQNIETLTQPIYTYEFVILCYLSSYIIGIQIVQAWKYVNIYYFYVYNSFLFVHDIFGLCLCLIIYLSNPTYKLLIGLAIIQFIIIVTNIILQILVCKLQKMKPFLIVKYHQVVPLSGSRIDSRTESGSSTGSRTEIGSETGSRTLGLVFTSEV